MERPGIEPGAAAWKASLLTTTLRVIALKNTLFILFLIPNTIIFVQAQAACACTSLYFLVVLVFLTNQPKYN